MIRLFTYAAIGMGLAQTAFALTIATPACEQKDGSVFTQYGLYTDSFVGVLHYEKGAEDDASYKVLFCKSGRALDGGKKLSSNQEAELEELVRKAANSKQSFTIKQIASAARASGIPASVQKIKSNNCVCNNWGIGSK